MPYIPVLALLGGSVGTGEWIVLFVVILIVVGPKRLPEVARKIGRMMEMFRRAADEFKEQLMSIDQDTTPSSSSSSDYTYPEDRAEHEGYTYPEDSDLTDHSDYPDNSDYPGNEDQVESWESNSETAPNEPAPTDSSEATTAAPVDSAKTPDQPVVSAATDSAATEQAG